MIVKWSARNFHDQLNHPVFMLCTRCGGDGAIPEAQRITVQCGRCGGSEMEPPLSFQEAHASVNAGLALMRVLDIFAARRLDDPA